MEQNSGIQKNKKGESGSIAEIAKRNFVLWNEALLTGNPKKVAVFYSDRSTFLPTMSSDLKLGTEEAEGYFEHFCQKNPAGKIIDEKVQKLSDDSYLHTGLYNFEVDGKNGREIVEARFSYVWQKENDEWKIIHHHSSVKPQ